MGEGNCIIEYIILNWDTTSILIEGQINFLDFQKAYTFLFFFHWPEEVRSFEGEDKEIWVMEGTVRDFAAFFTFLQG